MGAILAFLGVYRWLAMAAVISGLVLGFFGWEHHIKSVARDEGRAEIQLKWDQQVSELRARALAESEANAKETARRLAAQKENEDAHAKELAAAQAAADRNARDAERVRKQAATAADQWSHTLRNSPTAGELAAAADTIAVLTDVRGRLDRHASVLAEYADTARAAGLKCERDYTALTAKP